MTRRGSRATGFLTSPNSHTIWRAVGPVDGVGIARRCPRSGGWRAVHRAGTVHRPSSATPALPTAALAARTPLTSHHSARPRRHRKPGSLSPGLLLQPIQDSLDLHPVLETSGEDDWVAPPSSQSRERDAHIPVPGTWPPTARITNNISGDGAPARAQRAILLVDAGSGPPTMGRRFHPQICRKTPETEL